MAGNRFLPSMMCPDKYFKSISSRVIPTDRSPDFAFSCTKQEYKCHSFKNSHMWDKWTYVRKEDSILKQVLFLHNSVFLHNTVFAFLSQNLKNEETFMIKQKVNDVLAKWQHCSNTEQKQALSWTECYWMVPPMLQEVMFLE